MSTQLENSDDFAYLDRCLDEVRAGLARYGRELRQPILLGRSDLDRVAYLLVGGDQMPAQLWIHTGVDRARRELAIAQAVAALVAILLEPDVGDVFTHERWRKVVLHLKHDVARPPVVALGAPPPPVAMPRPSTLQEAKVSDSSGLRVKWIQSDGIRPVSLDQPLCPKGELTEVLSKEPAARMIGAFLKPRARVSWGLAGSGGLVAILDLEQLKAKTAFLDAIADTAPCGNGEIALRSNIRAMLRPRNHLTGDALLMLGVPSGSSQVQLVAASGVWRVARRVLDQIQYEVSIGFVWALPAKRGAYRKHLAETMAQGLADELDRVCLESKRGGRASSVVSRIFGRSQIEFEATGMELLATEFRRRCKKSRGRVPFGGVDVRITKPRIFES